MANIAHLILNGTDMLNQYRLMISAYEDKPKSPRVKRIEVPGRSGGIDLTEVLGGVDYDARVIKCTLVAITYDRDDFVDIVKAFDSAYNGQTVIISRNDESNNSFTGRLSMTESRFDYPEGYISFEIL